VRERGLDLKANCGSRGHRRIFALFSPFCLLSRQLGFAHREVQLVVKSFNFSGKKNSRLGSSS